MNNSARNGISSGKTRRCRRIRKRRGGYSLQNHIHIGEILLEAGAAFNKLSEMTMLLHSEADLQPGGKWTNRVIEMLKSCIHCFAVDLNVLRKHIKSKTASETRTIVKKKAFEDAGIPVRQVSSTVTSEQVSQVSHLSQVPQITLNTLNAATESDPDDGGLTGNFKLDFEGCSDDVSIAKMLEFDFSQPL